MKKPVLLVDDPKQALAALGRALTTVGYEVRTIEGTQALDDFARSTPELMFIQLAEGGGTGVTIAEQIRQRADGALVPILFVGSGQEMITSVSDALAVGGDFFFQHPLDLDKVLAKVRAYIGVSETGSEEVTHPNVALTENWDDFDFDSQSAKRKWVDATVRSEADANKRLESAPAAPAIDPEAIRKQVDKRQEDEAKRRSEEQTLREAQGRAQKQAEVLAKQHEEALAQMERRKQEEEELARKKTELEIREKIAAELAAKEAQESEQRAEAERLRHKRMEEERAAIAKRAEEERARKEEERAAIERKRLEDERKRIEEERARALADLQKRELDTQKRAEVEARTRAEAQKRFEQETRERIEADARKQIDALRAEMEAKLRAEAQARSEEDARRRAEQDTRERIEQETRERLAQEARERIEDERRRIDEERRRVEEELRRAEEDTRRRAEQDVQRRRDEEQRQRLESEALRKQAEEQQKKVEEEIRARIEREYADARGFALPQPASDPGVDGLRVHPPQVMSGILADRHVAGVLGLWATEQVTGKVVFTRGIQEKIIALEHGQPVAFTSSDAMDRFEEFLHREHLLTRQQYQACRLRQLGGPRQTGAFIVSEGYLKPEELFDAVRRHLEESVHNLFEWDEGAWLYRPELAASEERIVLTTSMERLVVDGVRRRYLIARMIKLIGPPSSLLVPSGVEFQADKVGLDGKERALFKLLDGTRSIEDLVFSSGLSEERVYQLFTALEALGFLTVAVRGQQAQEDNSENSDAIDRARIKERFELAKKADYFEFLSIPATATEFDIERALAGARKLYSVERFAARVSSELALELKEIERVLADAEYVLRDARLRDAYVQHLGRRIA